MIAKNNTATTATTKPAAEATAAPAPVLKLRVVKKDLKFKGARQAWYDRLKALDGKTRDEVLADLDKRRPSVYGSKSKHAGKPEPVAGWVRFYERNGYIAFVQ